MKPKFFPTQKDLRNWFKKNYLKEKELIVGYYKVATGKPSVNWSQSVDEALCFGWIDGIRRSIDEESYSIRFTPRKPNSNWSAININKVKELTKQNLMFAEGLNAFNKGKENKSEIYGYGKKSQKLRTDFNELLKANKKAWTFFNSQPEYYKRVVENWIMSAKQETTKLKRLKVLIDDSAAGLKIKQMRPNNKK